MNNEAKGGKKLSADEIAVFCDQLAMLLNGGIPIYEGTYILYSEMDDKATKEVLKKVDEALKENLPLHEACKKADAFPDYMIYMIRVGETTGKLEEVLHSLCAYYERESMVAASIKSAVAYPVVLFSMMAVILLVLVWKILPLFENMFRELSTDIASATEGMMSFGMQAGKVIAIVTCTVLIIVLLIILWYQTKSGERFMKKFLVHFRLTKKLTVKIAIGKFLSSMSLMISSGMNITDALELAQESTDNNDIKERIIKCRDLYEAHKPLDEALRETKLVFGMEGRMLSVATKSGSTDVIFSKLSDQYNQSTTASLNKISSMIETIMVVVLSLLVGAVLLSVMLPLVSMISSIG